MTLGLFLILMVIAFVVALFMLEFCTDASVRAAGHALLWFSLFMAAISVISLFKEIPRP